MFEWIYELDIFGFGIEAFIIAFIIGQAIIINKGNREGIMRNLIFTQLMLSTMGILSNTSNLLNITIFASFVIYFLILWFKREGER